MWSHDIVVSILHVAKRIDHPLRYPPQTSSLASCKAIRGHQGLGLQAAGSLSGRRPGSLCSGPAPPTLKPQGNQQPYQPKNMSDSDGAVARGSGFRSAVDCLSTQSGEALSAFNSDYLAGVFSAGTGYSRA